jgi:pyruvate formate lyase activating enzyme
VTAWALTEKGACKVCGAICAGRFDGKPGAWGNRRLPIEIGEHT